MMKKLSYIESFLFFCDINLNIEEIDGVVPVMFGFKIETKLSGYNIRVLKIMGFVVVRTSHNFRSDMEDKKTTKYFLSDDENVINVFREIKKQLA